MKPAEMNVLVVDDEVVCRSVLLAILKKIGFINIDEASDGVEALNMVNQKQKEKQRYHLIFSDYMMPEMDGINFYNALEAGKYLGECKFFMVSTKAEKSVVQALAYCGVKQFLVKPIEAKTVMSKIRSAFS